MRDLIANVTCYSPDEARELLRYWNGFGYTWNGGSSLVGDTHWHIGDGVTDYQLWHATSSSPIRVTHGSANVSRTHRADWSGTFAEYLPGYLPDTESDVDINPEDFL